MDEGNVKEIEAKSILRKHKKIDSWFISRYGMNLYRGCLHNCVYCDGRSYYVNGEFGKNIAVKINAIEILRRELASLNHKNGFIMIGGGVGDAYQPAEEKYKLAKKALQLISEHSLPVHILTKSTLIERDIDIIKESNEKSKAIVSFSFSSVNKDISKIFEPNVASPEERLNTLALFKKEGISTGMFLLPVIPFITDSPELIEEAVKMAKETVDFIIFGGMTLKEGKQKNYFYNVLQERYPWLIDKYEKIYKGNKWGEATKEYYDRINKIFNDVSKKYKMPRRIPPAVYKDMLNEKDLVIVILEHIDYLLRLDGKKSPFGYAAYSISQLKKPLKKNMLREIKGVGKVTESIIQEILETGSSSYYEKLLRGEE